MSEPTRGERNNNPGNINYVAGIKWQGQLGLELVPPGHCFDPRFARFDTPVNGIRALAKQLLVYEDRYDLRSPRKWVNRWAPGSDNNNDDSYLAFVCQSTGAGPDQDIDLHDLDDLCSVVIAFIGEENGRCLYDKDTIQAACRSALGL